jgi:hypothetical protein
VTLTEHDLHHPLVLEAGSIAVYHLEGNISVHSILPGQFWPGNDCLPDQHIADLEPGSRGRRVAIDASDLKAIAAGTRWAIERQGSIRERVQAALRAYGRPATQEHLARLVCARRETISMNVGRRREKRAA